MVTVSQVCNCSCCDISVLCGRLYHFIFKRKRKIDKINASQIFNRDDLIKARPSVIIPSGGRFESIDYEPSQNVLLLEDEGRRGYRYITGQFFTKCFLVFLTGFLTGVTGAIAEYSIEIISCFKNAYLRSYLIGDYQANINDFYLYGFLINLGLAFFGSFVVVFIEPAATGGGIAGLMGFLNGVNVPKSVSFKVYVVKLISLICMSSAGLPGGKEGPMIHMGGILGAALPNMVIPFTKIRIFPNMRLETERRDLSAAGVAAGLAAAFGTPLGAFLLALEEFISFWTGDLFLKIFMCSVVSAITYNTFVKIFEGHIDDKMYGKDLLFLDSLYEMEIDSFSFFQLPFFIIIGVLGGILGSLWIFIHKFMVFFRRRFVKFKVLQVLEVLFWTMVIHFTYFTLLTTTKFCTKIPAQDDETVCNKDPHPYDTKMDCPKGQFATFALYSLQSNDRIFQNFLHNEEDLISLYPQLIMFVTYYLISGLFSGSMISAGLFVPNMISGAAFGRLAGLVANAFFHTDHLWWAPPHVCAFFGSASLLSPVVRLTFSLAVIYCEGSSAFVFFFPLIITLLCVKIVADVIIDGIYEVQYILAGIPIFGRYPPPLAAGLTAGDVMSRLAVVTLTTPTTVRRLIQVTFESRHNGFPIVDTKFVSRNDSDGGNSVGKLIGLILRSQILTILKNQWFENPPQVTTQRLSFFRRDFAEILTPRRAETKPGMNLDANVNLEPFMDHAPFCIKWNASLNRTYKIFFRIGIRHLIVVNSSNEVVGMITRKDLAKFKTSYNIGGVHVHTSDFN